MSTELRSTLAWVTGTGATLIAGAAFGQEADIVVDEIVEEVATISAGDTAWILTSTALVLMMTLPGLALFYGGLVRSKNILSVLMQCLISGGLMGVLWIYQFEPNQTNGWSWVSF